MALNSLLRTFVIEGREGQQLYIPDDHKQHIEFDPKKVKKLGL